VSRTRIKICGVTRLEDALAAVRIGADAIGLICHEHAPRYITPERASEIVAALPPFVTPVGVFVDADATTIVETADDIGLRAVQLNGNEPTSLVYDLVSFSVIKAVRIRDREETELELDSWRDAREQLGLANLTGVVLEPGKTGQPGGTGVANDWELVRKLIDDGAFEDLPPLIAAGGLTPENVGEVVRRIRPWAVDVSSGVESAKGIKSAEKIEAFIRAVREADGE
jgi:phosphoribosylanthranilate isomerase